MIIQLELWQLISLLLAFFGCVAGFAKLLFTQIDQRLDTRFEAQDKARGEGQRALRATLDAHLRDKEALAASVATLAARVASAEARAATGPNHDDLRNLYARINTVAEAQSRIEGVLQGIGDTQRLMLSKITDKGMGR